MKILPCIELELNSQKPIPTPPHYQPPSPPLCIEVGFYVGIFCESRFNIDINVFTYGENQARWSEICPD